MRRDHAPDCRKVIKVILIYYPDLPTDELMVKLKAIGYSPTSLAVATVRSAFRLDLRILREEGLLGDLPPKRKPPLWLKASHPSGFFPQLKPKKKPKRKRDPYEEPSPRIRERKWWPDD